MDKRHFSPAEIAVLRLIADGLTDQEIAVALFRSIRTIHTYRDRLLIKTESHNRVQLTRYAVAMGYVPVDWDNIQPMTEVHVG